MCEHFNFQQNIVLQEDEAEVWDTLVFTTESELLLEKTKLPPPISSVNWGEEEIVENDSDEDSGIFPRCNEGYSDIKAALYEKKRVDRVQHKLNLFKKWKKAGRSQEAKTLATWLYEHTAYGDIHEAKVLKILKEIADDYKAGVSHKIDFYYQEPTYYRFK